MEKENFPSQTAPKKNEDITRIGILGGSFDPPTTGHMQMAVEAVNLGHVDEVWIVPCGDRLDKNISVPGEKRLQMVKLIIEDFFQNEFPITVNDIEIKNKESIPTYFLIKKFEEEYKELGYEFFFIMGSDLLEHLHLWDEAEKMKEEMSFLIYRRTNSIIKPEWLPKNYIIINTTFVASSSTEVRKRIRENYKLHKNAYDDEEYDEEKYTSFETKNEMPQNIKLAGGKLKLIRKKSLYQKTFEEKYLGVYGIIPFSIISYIKENKLYKD